MNPEVTHYYKMKQIMLSFLEHATCMCFPSFVVGTQRVFLEMAPPLSSPPSVSHRPHTI